eukprot:1159739-Pelagomonas_calceolata.AAC.13
MSFIFWGGVCWACGGGEQDKVSLGVHEHGWQSSGPSRSLSLSSLLLGLAIFRSNNKKRKERKGLVRPLLAC